MSQNIKPFGLAMFSGDISESNNCFLKHGHNKHSNRGGPSGGGGGRGVGSSVVGHPQAKAKGKATPPPHSKPPACKIGAATPMGLCRVWGTPGMSLARRGAMGGLSTK